MVGVPWEPIPGREGIEIKTSVELRNEHPDIAKDVVGEEKEIKRRRLKITRGDIRMHGPTEGCAGCDNVMKGGKVAVNHSEDCRIRYFKILEDKGDLRVEREKERENRMHEQVGKEIQEQDKRKGKRNKDEGKDKEQEKEDGGNRDGLDESGSAKRRKTDEEIMEEEQMKEARKEFRAQEQEEMGTGMEEDDIGEEIDDCWTRKWKGM